MFFTSNIFVLTVQLIMQLFFIFRANSDVYDTNELPSKSANLLPEYTNPAWMLEQVDFYYEI